MRCNLSLLLLLFCITASAQNLVFKEFDINGGTASSRPLGFDTLNEQLLFAATRDTTGYELFSCNGNNAKLVKDIYPGKISGFFSPSSENLFGHYPGHVLFFGNDQNSYYDEPYIYDGSTTGPVKLYHIPGQIPPFKSIRKYASYKNQVLFITEDTSNNGITYVYITDGSIPGTKLLADLRQLSTDFCIYNGMAYFFAYSSTQLFCLYSTDGTPGGTSGLKNLFTADPANGYSGDLTVYNNHLYFIGTDTTYGAELNVTDGSTTGTHIVKDIVPGKQGGASHIIGIYNGKLYFSAGDANTTGIELYCTDGTDTGTHLLKDINPGKKSSVPTNFFVYNGRAYFSATDATHGTELWVTDGSATGTRIVKDILPGATAAYPSNFTAYKNHLYFFATSNSGAQLYISDGTDTGTRELRPAGVSPTDTSKYVLALSHGIIVYKGALWFAAKYNSDGVELWSLADTLWPQSINDNITSAFSIYPNPNNGNFTINTDIHTGIVTVYDITGRIILSADVKGNITDLQLPAGAKGIYFIKLQSGDAVSTKKILVQ